MKSALALLEALRPPPDFETQRALGTTYSADLVACMLALLNLDGGAAELTEVTRVSALRALHRQKSRVRIAVQQARIAWPGTFRPSLALLDRVLRPVPFDGNRCSFHPKVWMAHQRGPNQEERWVLTVGSRNLTSDVSWDLGLSLVGSRAQNNRGRATRLPGLTQFARGVCRLMGEEEFAGGFGTLDEILWELPDGCEGADFLYGLGRTETAVQDSAPLRLVRKAERVLVVSPFLDAGMVNRTATAVADHAEVRLVAGGLDLEKVAGTKSGEALITLNPHSFHVSDPDDPAPVNTAALEERADRGLHAKFILVQRGERSRLLLGSHNLTVRAWGGANCEASLELLVDPGVAEGLWRWSDDHALSFVPTSGPREDAQREHLETIRNAVGAATLLLREPPGTSEAVLEALQPLIPASSQVRLEVARVTQHEQCACWAPGSTTVTLPACATSERTALLLFRATFGDEQMRWAQQVEVKPTIDDARDSEALVRILGPLGFLHYLQSILGEGEPTTQEGEPPEGTGSGRRSPEAAVELDGFRLEPLLRRFAREGGAGPARIAFEEASRLITDHRAAVDRAVTTEHERQVLNQLWALWDVLARGLVAA